MGRHEFITEMRTHILLLICLVSFIDSKSVLKESFDLLNPGPKAIFKKHLTNFFTLWRTTYEKHLKECGAMCYQHNLYDSSNVMIDPSVYKILENMQQQQNLDRENYEFIMQILSYGCQAMHLYCDFNSNPLKLVSKNETVGINYMEELMNLVEIGFSESQNNEAKSNKILKTAIRRTSTIGKIPQVQYLTKEWFENGMDGSCFNVQGMNGSCFNKYEHDADSVFTQFLYRFGPDLMASAYRKYKSIEKQKIMKCSVIIDEMRFYLDSSSIWIVKTVGLKSKLHLLPNNEQKLKLRQKYLMNGLAGFLVETTLLLTGDQDVQVIFEKSCNRRNKVLVDSDFD